MNIIHLKYAVEIEKTRSISKAAENLFMAQPNLSRAIKELEESIGIAIFNRTPKGITVTPDGEEFLHHARKILRQVEEMEQMYANGNAPKQEFSVCAPRASYISLAFTQFARKISNALPAEISYKETNSSRAIDNLVKEKCNLAIVRYQTAFEKYFRMMFEDKRIAFETIADFSYRLVMSKNHPLAQSEDIKLSQLSDYIEICHADPYIPSLPAIDARKAELSEFVDKHIYIYERGTQFELLENIPNTFMWVSPIPPALIEAHNLVEKNSSENNRIYRDVLIYRKGYVLTDLDKAFITEVCDSKRKYIG